ncbi:MAG: signal transduction histidine kinase [Flammeovirgaceae bacterium]|jgi:signal transduction histidine kinase
MNNELSNMVEERTEKLLDSKKLASLGQLTASIAHELNTPLGAIQSSTQSAQHSIGLFIELLSKVAKEMDEIDFDMVGQLLSYSKDESSILSTSQARKQRKLLELNLAEHFPMSDKGLSRDLQRLGIQSLDNNLLKILKSDKSLLILEVTKRTNEILRSNETALNASQKASKVVMALKTYAHNSHEEEREQANINDGIEMALTILQNQLKIGVELEKELTPIPNINCFPDELNQVWLNLIQNSMHAMDKHGKLYISSCQSGNFIEVVVRDDGKGIPTNIQDRIFNPFFTTKATGEGSGLGLSIINKIVEKHEGEINLVSSEGEGATFTVRLPIQ